MNDVTRALSAIEQGDPRAAEELLPLVYDELRCLYFTGLNLSNEQIARELDLNPDDVQRMTTQLREGIVRRKPPVVLAGEVECDEVSVVAGHKGHPEAVRKKGESPAADAWRGPRAGGPWRRRSRRSSR